MSNTPNLSGAVFENTLTVAPPNKIYLHTSYLTRRDVLHYHRSIEIGICQSGSGVSETEGRVMPFSAGDISIIFPFQRHRNYTTGGDGECVWKWFFIDPVEIAAVTNGSAAFLSTLMEKVARWGIIRGDGEIEQLVKALMEAISAGGDYCCEKAYSLLVLLLIGLVERSEGSDMPPVALPARFESVVTMLVTVNRELLEGRQLTVEELSALCRIPVSTCRRIFLSTLHMTPKEYILSCALEAAKVLLATTDRSITEIAGMTGFAEISTFNRAFRAREGMTPRAFRGK